jgi:hypothetical protein
MILIIIAIISSSSFHHHHHHQQGNIHILSYICPKRFEQRFARVPMDLAAGGKSLVQPQDAAIDR